MSHAAAKQEGDLDNLKDSAVAVKDAVADLAQETSRFARARVSDARDSASAMLDTVKSKAEDYNDSLIGVIRKNPYRSLAIAAGIGFAAGMLLRRR